MIADGSTGSTMAASTVESLPLPVDVDGSTAKPAPILAVWQALADAQSVIASRNQELSRLRECVNASRRVETRMTKLVEQLQQDLIERDRLIREFQTESGSASTCTNQHLMELVNEDLHGGDGENGSQWVAASQVAELASAAKSLADAVRAREAKLAEVKALSATQAARIQKLQGMENAAAQQAVHLQSLVAWQAAKIAELESQGKSFRATGSQAVANFVTADLGVAPYPDVQQVDRLDNAERTADAVNVAPESEFQEKLDEEPELVSTVVWTNAVPSSEAEEKSKVADCKVAIAEAIAGVLREKTFAASAAAAFDSPLPGQVSKNREEEDAFARKTAPNALSKGPGSSILDLPTVVEEEDAVPEVVSEKTITERSKQTFSRSEPESSFVQMCQESSSFVVPSVETKAISMESTDIIESPEMTCELERSCSVPKEVTDLSMADVGVSAGTGSAHIPPMVERTKPPLPAASPRTGRHAWSPPLSCQTQHVQHQPRSMTISSCTITPPAMSLPERPSSWQYSPGVCSPSYPRAVSPSAHSPPPMCTSTPCTMARNLTPGRGTPTVGSTPSTPVLAPRRQTSPAQRSTWQPPPRRSARQSPSRDPAWMRYPLPGALSCPRQRSHSPYGAPYSSYAPNRALSAR